MTKLLVSVKNVQEAQIALEASADFIDLKDPSVGALGSLDDRICSEVVQLVKKKIVISATVGEGHNDADELLSYIDTKSAIGIDVIKLPINQFFDDTEFVGQLKLRAMEMNTKFVAVMFADELVDLTLIAMLANTGFYGVMLDISNKQSHLLSSVDSNTINAFVKKCKKHNLIAGLAGSLRIADVKLLVSYRASYIGFRSGVCENNIRNNTVTFSLINTLRTMLYKSNTIA